MPTTSLRLPRFRNAQAVVLLTLFWAVVMAGVLVLSVALSEGHLIYTLDDPYIHLALAEMLLEGHWGVNPGERASPASSAIYPLLLAVFEAFGIGQLGPLVLGFPAAGLSVWLLMRLFWSCAVPNGQWPVLAVVICPLLILAIGAWTLPMTGLEHILHVLSVLALLTGLAHAGETGRFPAFAMVALILMPLLRFEGVALAGAAILVLLWQGQRRSALIAGFSILIALGIYVALMRGLGLPALPGSVMLKSDVASAVGEGGRLTSLVRDLFATFKNALSIREGTMLALAICAIAGGAVRTLRRGKSWCTPEMSVGVAAMLALLAHMVGGRFGWFGRLEIYAVAAGLFALIYIYRRDLEALFAGRRHGQQITLLGVVLVLVFPYGQVLYRTPEASRNIYEQQYQMHRFATEFYPGPVAVNDLGWMTYQNDLFVLDLWGLGSDEVRRLKMTGAYDADAIRRLTEAHDVRYAMIYERWYRGMLPEDWCLVAELRTDKVSAAFADVQIYAVTALDQAPLEEALTAFRPTLPPRVRLEGREGC